MSASVTRLRPRPGSYKRGLAAYRAARLRHCLGELTGVEAFAASALRARAYLRLGNAEEALASLWDERVTGGRDRAELAMLRGAANSRLGHQTRAASEFVDAVVYAVSAAEAPLEAEVYFYQGLFALGRGELDDAREACARALERARTPELFPLASREDVVPPEHVVARVEELLGIVDGASGDYSAQIAHAREALAVYEASGTTDVYVEAFALRNLAILARDFDLPDAGTVRERAGRLAWTEDIARVHFTTAEALGWCAALRGDAVAALGLFRAAADAATTVPERVLIAVDRARLAREAGYAPMSIEEIDYALESASTLDWNDAAGDYRNVLLDLAVAAAPVAPLGARGALERYGAIRKAMDPTFASRIEARVRAEEDFAHGIVLRAEGRLDESRRRLESAFATWTAIGYEWRAGYAALELSEIGAGDVFRLAVRRELATRPNSFYANRAAAIA